MALRFRKSIKLAPGLRMNLTGSGLSWTLGPRGASIGIGKRGARLNAGLPGTGLYSSAPLAAGSPRRAVGTATARTVSLDVTMLEDGTLQLLDDAGNPTSEELIAAAKRQKGDVIRDVLQKKVDEINAQVEALGEIHLGTPSPDSKPTFTPEPFTEAEPRPPMLRQPGLMDKMFASRRQQLEAANAAAQARYDEDRRQWQARKAAHEEEQVRRRMLVENLIYRSATAMEIFLEETLQDIVWPRETDVTFEVSEDGKRVVFAVDLPEIEDFPRKTASLPARGFKASIKEMSDAKRRKLYMAHVHGVGFRIIGESFAALPTVEQVIVSAHSQRPDRATGQVRDEYLYSVRVLRDAWRQINFAALENIDVVEALERFELRRDMSKTGVFKPVEPIET